LELARDFGADVAIDIAQVKDPVERVRSFLKRSASTARIR